MDIRANETITLQPKETRLIPTGIFVGLPEGYEIQVRPRSGLSLKTKLRISNSPGTVDQVFLGEICVIAENTHGSLDFTVAKGERIAQIVLQEVPKIEWVQVSSKDDLGSTDRGEGGFGSSGVK
jgi:dUTP pyrophosphatase